jgi:hypothetical protein
MGGFLSTPIAGPDTPQKTKDILETVVKELLSRTDLNDLYGMADPERCKNYIVATGNTLASVLKQQQLIPELGKGGIMYFRSVKDFQKNDAAGEQHQDNCYILSFYFIRIFQIYGALTLSILDTSIPNENLLLGITPTAQQQQEKRYASTGVVSGFGFEQRGGSLPSTGRDSKYYLLTNTVYKLLNKYLQAPVEDTNIQNLKAMKFVGYPLYIPQKDLYGPITTIDTRAPKDPQQLSLIYKDEEAKYILKAVLNLEYKNGQNIEVKLSNVFFKAGIDQAEEPKKDPEAVLLIRNEAETVSYLSKDSKELPRVLVEMLLSTLPPPTFSPVQFLKDFGFINRIDNEDQKIGTTQLFVKDPKANLKQLTIPVVYKRAANEFVKTTLTIKKAEFEKIKFKVSFDFSNEGLKGTSDTIFKAYELEFERDSQDKMSKPGYRQVSEIFTLPSKNSRSASEFKTDSKRSSGSSLNDFITETFRDFFNIVDLHKKEVLEGRVARKLGFLSPPDASGIPESLKTRPLADALMKKPPIKAHCVARALQLLSVSGIRGGSLGESYSLACQTGFLYEKDKSLPPSADKYLESAGIMELSRLFVQTVKQSSPNAFKLEEYETKLAGLATLKTKFEETDAALKALCASAPSSRLMLQNQQQVQQVRVFVQKLFMRQQRHLGNVMNLFDQLFDLNRIRAGSFGLNTRVLQRGLKEVERIGEVARELLISYYSDCEVEYKSGLMALQKMNLTKQAVSTTQQQQQAPQQKQQTNNNDWI